MFNKFIPFKYKLSIYSAVLVVVSIAILGASLYIYIANDLTNDCVKTQDSIQRIIIGRLEKNNKVLDFKNASDDIADFNDSVDGITFFSLEGNTVYETYRSKDIKDSVKILLNDKAAKVNNPISYIENINGKRETFRYISYGGGNNEIIIGTAFNHNTMDARLSRAKWVIIICMLITFLLAITYGIFMANRISKPINIMLDGMNHISNGKFDAATNISSNDEFELLSKSFDNMVGDIKELLNERNDHLKELSNMNREMEGQRDEISVLYQEAAAMNDELYELINEIKANYLSTVRALANAIEAKDEYTQGHCKRVTDYSLAIAREMGLSADEISQLEFASMLHDIGKIGIPLMIINKNGRLTNEEFDIIKNHPQIGYDILEDVPFLNTSNTILLQHHERIDGKGYPNGLTGDKLHKLSKILAAADSYDAMTSSRPYRPVPLTTEQAIQQLLENKNTQFDSEVVDALVSILEKETYQIGTTA